MLEDRDNAELHLKTLTEHILLQFFATTIVDYVDIYCLPEAIEESRLFSIQIIAQCTSAFYPLPPHGLLEMELALEDRLSRALLQLVGGRVDIEDVSIGDLLPEAEQDFLIPTGSRLTAAKLRWR